MMYTIILLTLYNLASSKRLLQQFGPTLGTYGQICSAPQSDFECQRTHSSINDQQQGTLECGVDYSCCLCQTIVCGSASKWCDALKIGGEFGAFGVQDIRVYGNPDTTGAVLDCGAPNACASTRITGKWINTLQCAGDGACNSAVFDVSMSHGITCDKESCVGGKFIMNSNIAGDINCGAQQACVGAEIEINGIEQVKCNGRNACQAAKITVNSPSEHFHLDCNGILACENMEIILNIPEPEGGCAPNNYAVMEWKGISCGTNGGCEGLKFTVVNNGCQMIRIEDLQCNPGRACTGAVFDFNAGSGLYGVELQNCMCGPSCLDATGIDQCYSNVRTLECLDAKACAAQTRTITNPANDFLLLCPTDSSCAGLELNLVISGASQNLVQRVDGFYCGATKSCANAKINIFNTQTTSAGASVPISVSDIICSKAEACNGATFITGANVQIERVICVDGACDNCVIKQTASSEAVACSDGAAGPIFPIANVNNIITPPDIASIPSIPSAIQPNIALEQPPFLVIDPAQNTPQIPAVPKFIPNIETPPVLNSNPSQNSPQIPAVPSIPQIPAFIQQTPPVLAVDPAQNTPQIPAVPRFIPIPETPPVLNSNSGQNTAQTPTVPASNQQQNIHQIPAVPSVPQTAPQIPAFIPNAQTPPVLPVFPDPIPVIPDVPINPPVIQQQRGPIEIPPFV